VEIQFNNKLREKERENGEIVLTVVTKLPLHAYIVPLLFQI
jgi:hypothetical protein